MHRLLMAATLLCLAAFPASAQTYPTGLVTPERRSPAYLAEFVKAEVDKWAAPIKASGARVE